MNLSLTRSTIKRTFTGLALAVALATTLPAMAECPSTGTTASLSLADALARLNLCNRDVLLSRQYIEAARADLLTADRGQNPNLTLGSATISPQSGIGPGGLMRKQIDWQARIDQPIERGNRRALRAASASSAIEAARWNAADVLRQQKLALAQTWIDLWTAQEQVKLAGELRALYLRTEDAARIRLRVGDIAANDLSRISVDTQRAENDVRRAETERNRNRFELARLLGLEDSAASLVISAPWPASGTTNTPPPTPEALRAASRPDLQAARAVLKNADDQRALARSLRERDVSVGVQLDRYPQPAGTGNSFSLSLSMPLFTQHTNQGELARSEADYTSALLNLQRTEQAAVNEQQRLEAERAAVAARATQLRERSLPLTEAIAANADLAYKRGASSVLDLLDALRQLRQMQAEVLAAQTDYHKADAAARAAALNTDASNDPIFGMMASPGGLTTR